MSNSLGNIKDISINIDSPLPFKAELEFKELILLTGTNGSGKSLLLKLNWVINYISQAYLALKQSGVNPISVIDIAQEAFDKSFINQDFNGDINVNFDSAGNDIVINIDKGKITKFDIKFDKSISFTGFPVFMSTETRSYNDIQKYLQLRKSLGIIGSITHSVETKFNDLTKLYRLYDIMFLERFYSSLMTTPLILKSNLQKILKDNYNFREEIVSIGIDEVKSEIYFINSAGQVKNITSLSKGEQALLNMLTVNYL